jgi:hypothetical protein
MPNALTQKSIKYGFLVTGIWTFNIDIDDFLPSVVTGSPLQGHKNLENFEPSDCHTCNSNLDNLQGMLVMLFNVKEKRNAVIKNFTSF